MEYSAGKPIPSLWLLGIASGLSPFGMAIVVPALSSIGARFEADFATIQYVISAYLLGLAVAQPLTGFFCDRFGRRPVLLLGFLTFVAASLLCAIAPTINLLIVARFVQALGVSVGTVASRAILRDTHDSNRMAEAMSYIAAAMGIAPIIAPIFGGLINESIGYTWIFAASAAMGAVVLVGMFVRLSETLPAQFERPRLGQWFRNYRHLMTSRSFVGNTLIFGFVQGSFFCFMAIGAELFDKQFDIQSGRFGLLWGLLSIAYVVGAAVAARLTPVFGTKRVLGTGVWLSVLAGVAIWISAIVGPLTVFKVLLPLGLLITFAGVTTPGSMAAAVSDHPSYAGTAAGLSSALGLVVGGSFSVLSGTIYRGDYQPIAFIMLLACAAVGASWLLANKTSRRSSALDPTG